MAIVFLLGAICICASIQMDLPLVMVESAWVERKVIGQGSALCNVTKGLSSSPGVPLTNATLTGFIVLGSVTVNLTL